MQEIAGGNYDRPWPGSTIAEFSELEGHLQTMAVAIQAREKALSASEAKYRPVVSNAPVIIVQIDPDGMIGLIEGKGLAAMGMKPGEGEGKSWFDLFRYDNDLCDRVRKAIAGKEQQFTSEHERGVFDIHLAPVPDGGDSCSVLCIAVDITRRVMAEKALQEYACLLEESQKVARLGFYIFHPPAMTWQASEVLDEILGIDDTYSRSQEGFLDLVHPEDRPMISAYLFRSMQKLHVPFDEDFRIVRADNRKERYIAGSGEDGLRFLQTAEVDLVILDMLMGPGMNGYETYLKILEIHPGQKAIIASGYSQSADVREAMESGVKKFVRKPYSIRKLAVVLRETLRQE
ncbi:MAG: response regulator [Desulfoprunum sp.]|uniref:response regulator n=1 Tax=Desulfoprunum sp. TaxID=2020866 RepID=UPI003C79664F